MSGQNVQRPLDALGKSVDSPVLIKLKEFLMMQKSYKTEKLLEDSVLCSLEETILFTFHHNIIFRDYIVCDELRRCINVKGNSING